MKYMTFKEQSLALANQPNRTQGISLDQLLDLQESLGKQDYEKMIEESIDQAIGKQATKEVTGLLGAPLSKLMSASVVFYQPLTDEEIYELHAIEQIGVQFKNIAKRGLWEQDDLIKLAIKVASKYGIEDIVLNATSIVRGKTDTMASLEEPIVEVADFFDTAKKKNSNNNNNNTGFDFSNL